MVVLRNLFNLLASGEFSNIALSRDTFGNIDEAEYSKVVEHINLGVLEIYKKFKLLQNEIDLYIDPTVEIYYLRSTYMGTIDNISTTKYLLTPVATEGLLNIIEITGVFDSLGAELPMNNRFTVPAIMQVSDDVLKITGHTAEEVYSISYQAHPDEIVVGDTFDPDTTILYISKNIITALLYFVASRVYKPMGANDSTANADKSASYEQKYELAMQKLDMYGLELNNNDEEDTFLSEGWA